MTLKHNHQNKAYVFTPFRGGGGGGVLGKLHTLTNDECRALRDRKQKVQVHCVTRNENAQQGILFLLPINNRIAALVAMSLSHTHNVTRYNGRLDRNSCSLDVNFCTEHSQIFTRTNLSGMKNNTPIGKAISKVGNVMAKIKIRPQHFK